MKLPSDETPANMNEEGYISDEYDQLEIMPAPIRDGDFSEYMWMENEEEFNSQVLRQLEEEELMEQCIVAMLDDEFQMANNNSRNNTNDNTNSRSSASENNVNSRNNANDSSNSLNGLSESVNSLSISSNGVLNNSNPSSNITADTSNYSRPYSAQDRLRRLRQTNTVTNNVPSSESEQKSTLNPDAKEFVPLTRTSSESSPNNENVFS